MPLNKEDRKKVRNTLFRHLDGIATIPSCLALEKNKTLSSFLSAEKQSLNTICENHNTNKAYLNVALRLCCSQGWLLQEIIDNDCLFCITNKGKSAIKQLAIYENLRPIIPKLIEFNEFLSDQTLSQRAISSIIQFGNNLKTDQDYQIHQHLCGLILGPMLVYFGMGDHLNKTGLDANKFEGVRDSIFSLFELMASLKWGKLSNTVFTPNDYGSAFFDRSSAYGVTVSYLPMFNRLDELLYGDPTCLWNRAENTAEIHVNRTMNVWGSGGAHGAYFGKVDEIVKEIFNRPLDEQPAGIADMGCGNGALLGHLFNLIENETLRGKHLETHYLHLIGADLNKAALIASKENLAQQNIEAEFLYADISKPEEYAKDLKERYDVNLGDLLNVRSFLDHNRIYQKPTFSGPYPASNSTGAFAYRGRFIPNDEVECNLTEHFSKWKPYLKRFGLIVIELHSLAPILTASKLGETAVTAYDGTHGYSDQYIVEKEVFLKCSSNAGLVADPAFKYYFPSEDCATVSIHLLK